MKIALLKNNNWLLENGYSRTEEREAYAFCLHEIYENPRWYLDNLEYLVEFRVSFLNYKKAL